MSGRGKERLERGLSGLWPVVILDTSVSLFASLIAVLYVRLIRSEVLFFQTVAFQWFVLSVVFSLLAIFLSGSHKVVLLHASYKSIIRSVSMSMIKVSCFALVILAGIFTVEDPDFAWSLVIADFLFTIVFMILARLFLIIFYDSMLKSPEEEIGKLVVMVYGTSMKSVAMVTRLQQSTHYNVVGFISSDKSLAGRLIADKKVFYAESSEDLQKIKVSQGLEGVLFARDNEMASTELVQKCIQEGIHILVSPNIDQVDCGGVETVSAVRENSNQVAFIADGMSPFGRITKRLIDLAASSVLLIIFSPLMLICFIALKLTDKGPAFFKQERIGRFGRPFTIYKFRSMRLDAEDGGPALLQGEKDPRLTKVGGFLRAHHLDELPQLWNVFLGDMAFVGPRPERKFFIEKIMEADRRYSYLYQIRPGVTSYATLYNGYTDTLEKMIRRLELDLYYLRNRSLWFDAKVLFMTFVSIVFGKKF